MVSVSHLLTLALLTLSVRAGLAAGRAGRHGRRRKEGPGDGPGRSPGRNSSDSSGDKFSMREYVHKHRRASVYCFQCAFSPDKDVYETIKAIETVKDKHGRTRLAYKTRLMKVRRQGGWDKCVGPFDHTEADKFGIDVKECDNTCYARLEKSGNIFRGCYKGSYEVDPNKYGCHEQQGSIWCFCRGHVCNHNEIIDDFPSPTSNSYFL